MGMQKNRFKCQDCGPVYKSHFSQWSEDLFSFLLPLKVSQKRIDSFSRILDGLFLRLGLLYLSNDVSHKKIYFRTKVFIEEAEKLGIKVRALRSKQSFINRFYMDVNGKTFAFEGVPMAEFLNKVPVDKIDDKIFVKNVLKKNGVPTPNGRSFWFWQKGKAIRWAIKNLGYPMIVKPRAGSMSQHMTPDIKSRSELSEAIKRAIRYSPVFIIEEFLSDMNVYRATVVDGKDMAVVRRIPAHVIGDGVNSIQELVDMKNQDPERGEACAEDCTTFKLAFDKTSERILSDKGISKDYIPKEGELVFIQEKVILDIGADLEGVTDRVHPDNKELFCKVAGMFGLKLTGVDFLAPDISKSWKEQRCAILELNSMPFIDMHHHPTYGEPVNVGRLVAEMVKKYYK